MISGEASAWLSGLAAGVIIGGAAVYALHFHAFRFARRIQGKNAVLRALLFDLQSAEGRYRQSADYSGEQHPQTMRAWEDMRETGNRARQHLFDEGSAFIRDQI